MVWVRSSSTRWVAIVPVGVLVGTDGHGDKDIGILFGVQDFFQGKVSRINLVGLADKFIEPGAESAVKIFMDETRCRRCYAKQSSIHMAGFIGNVMVKP